MKTLQEYEKQYSQTITNALIEKFGSSFSIKKEVWIYFQWEDDNEIDAPYTPRFREKLKETMEQQPELANVLAEGLEAIEKECFGK